mmetsp:Transcript_3000/g.4165  ORF Transcript_3000/g.4165 Transcript_3000/m.4165 type:complete len:236 (+) Transcript_3000:2385-3092(+)
MEVQPTLCAGLGPHEMVILGSAEQSPGWLGGGRENMKGPLGPLLPGDEHLLVHPLPVIAQQHQVADAGRCEHLRPVQHVQHRHGPERHIARPAAVVRQRRQRGAGPQPVALVHTPVSGAGQRGVEAVGRHVHRQPGLGVHHAVAPAHVGRHARGPRPAATVGCSQCPQPQGVQALADSRAVEVRLAQQQQEGEELRGVGRRGEGRVVQGPLVEGQHRQAAGKPARLLAGEEIREG